MNYIRLHISSNSKEYYRNNIDHRPHHPAIIDKNGDMVWIKNNHITRMEGPTITLLKKLNERNKKLKAKRMKDR